MKAFDTISFVRALETKGETKGDMTKTVNKHVKCRQHFLYRSWTTVFPESHTVRQTSTVWLVDPPANDFLFNFEQHRSILHHISWVENLELNRK